MCSDQEISGRKVGYLSKEAGIIDCNGIYLIRWHFFLIHKVCFLSSEVEKNRNPSPEKEKPPLFRGRKTYILIC